MDELDRLTMLCAAYEYGSHWVILPRFGLTVWVNGPREIPMPRYRNPLRMPSDDRDIILKALMEEEE